MNRVVARIAGHLFIILGLMWVSKGNLYSQGTQWTHTSKVDAITRKLQDSFSLRGTWVDWWVEIELLIIVKV